MASWDQTYLSLPDSSLLMLQPGCCFYFSSTPGSFPPLSSTWAVPFSLPDPAHCWVLVQMSSCPPAQLLSGFVMVAFQCPCLADAVKPKPLALEKKQPTPHEHPRGVQVHSSVYRWTGQLRSAISSQLAPVPRCSAGFICRVLPWSSLVPLKAGQH